MKKYIYCTLFTVAALCCGCKEFLSTESPSSLGPSVFISPDQTEQAIAGIYVILGEQNSYRTRLGGYWVVPGTDCEMHTSNAADYAIYTMTKVGHSDLNAKDKHPWAYLTMAIERANLVIEGIENYSDTLDTGEAKNTRLRYLYGEALTLRAWLYYEMTKLWGDVPYMFSPMDGTDASIYPKKVDRNIIYEKLRVDLKHAASLMPKASQCPGIANNTVERCNREFALGLLARVDLMYAGKAMRPDQMVEGSTYSVKFNTTPEKRVELLNEAIKACEQVITDDGFGKLMDNYEDVFKAVSGSVTRYDDTESLFEIPFADGVRGQFMKRMGAYVNEDESKNHTKLKGISENFKSVAKVVITPAHLFSFDAKDKRKWVTVSPGEWTYDADSDIPGVTGSVLYQKPEKITKMYLGKYRPEWMSFNCPGDEDGINIPQMRFADILLMYAEASIGSVYEVTPTYQGSYSAQECFDKVRARAGLDPVELNMPNLMQERAWEFTGEFIRKYDLIRWGKFADNLWDTQEDLKHFTHLGEDGKISFAGTPYADKLPTNVYVKYVIDNSVTQDGSDAYRISEIYGLQLGENTKPDDYVDESDNGGWVQVDAFIDSSLPAMKVEEKGNLVFGVDLSKDVLEARQFWPIFNIITGANYNLYNDYGY